MNYELLFVISSQACSVQLEDNHVFVVVVGNHQGALWNDKDGGYLFVEISKVALD